MPEGIKCSIMCGNKKLEWVFEKKDKNTSMNYDAFISFLSQKTGVSDATSMDIYHMDNESDATSNGDAIKDCDDFGGHFNFNEGIEDETVYFKVRIKSSFQVKIDLNGADCKEEII